MQGCKLKDTAGGSLIDTIGRDLAVVTNAKRSTHKLDIGRAAQIGKSGRRR